MMGLWNIVEDDNIIKERGILSILFLLLSIIIAIPLTLFAVVILLAVSPTICLIRSYKHPEKVDEILQHEKEHRASAQGIRTKTPEEIEAERAAFREKYQATHFSVLADRVVFQPDNKEIFFYTPSSAPEVEKLKAKGYHLFFLPEYNRSFNDLETAERLDYYNPRHGALDEHPYEVLTYEDIRNALMIPDRVDAPCLIRYNSTNRGLHSFSFWKFEIEEGCSFLDAVKDYINDVGDGRALFSIRDEQEYRKSLRLLSADERFLDDVLTIGNEIRERVDKLRSMGLSTLAIRKLIGDDSDKPGKLFINKHNKLILTDFGNKEIKLEPLQKAVFFLFLRHPEGIYFKDLGDYRDELEAIYKKITGRDDLAGIQDSIDKLTDPLNNSINEKCARIKNAFVSEFREEVAQWYFIDGSKGEKKSIKLPRELVTWEIKD